MLCPVFPDVLEGDGVERLVEQIRPEHCEHVWAASYNDRVNWKHVRAGYAPDSAGYRWMTAAFGQGDHSRWSRYTTELYRRLLRCAKDNRWEDRLRYLLYEEKIVAADAPAYEGLRGVLLQSKPEADGTSKNKHFVGVQ